MPDVWGHERVRRMLGRALSKGRLAHAYLFCGPPRVGKRTVARAFARFLLCERARLEEGWGEGCGECPSCVLFQAGNHPDFVQVQPQTGGHGGPTMAARQEVIPIEAVRQIQRQSQYRPTRAKSKVFVLLQADTMTPEAANSLLKTLEEPPMGTCIILTAINRSALLPTILSRCVYVPFGLVPLSLVERFLRQEKRVPGSQAELIAALSGGRVGEASRLAEDPGFAGRWERTVGILDRLRAGPPGVALRLAEEIVAQASVPVEASEAEGEPFAGAESSGVSSFQVDQFLDLLHRFYRDALLSRWQQRDACLSRWHGLEEWARNQQPETLLVALQELQRARRLLRRNTNVQLVVEHLLLRLHPSSWSAAGKEPTQTGVGG